MDIYADLQKISIKDINASYKDISSGIDAGINRLGIELKGLLNYDPLCGVTLTSIIAVTS